MYELVVKFLLENKEEAERLEKMIKERDVWQKKADFTQVKVSKNKKIDGIYEGPVSEAP